MVQTLKVLCLGLEEFTVTGVLLSANVHTCPALVFLVLDWPHCHFG